MIGQKLGGPEEIGRAIWPQARRNRGYNPENFLGREEGIRISGCGGKSTGLKVQSWCKWQVERRS
jgi:hypothetical protein